MGVAEAGGVDAVSDLAAALMVAIKVHASQTDLQGEPYLLHVLRVVEAVSPEAKVVAALHDVLEDGGKGAERQVLGLYLSRNEGGALKLLTRLPGESYENYIRNIAYSPLAREVKRADLRDNLMRIPSCRPGFLMYGVGSERWASLKARYEKAITTLGAAA